MLRKPSKSDCDYQNRKREKLQIIKLLKGQIPRFNIVFNRPPCNTQLDEDKSIEKYPYAGHINNAW